ncbi:MAG: Flp family type IVb pilin [Geminicoccaceae bacterium]
MRPIVPAARTGRALARCARLLADERGATAIEYGLIAALMAVVIISGLTALGGETGGLYTVLDEIRTAIENALAG